MKIYMMTDLEGVAGVTDFENRESDTLANHEDRMRMKRLLTAEVNAAVAGLYDGGATQVIVNDGHGAGYTFDFENIDHRVQVVHGLERPVWLPLLDETCDATCLVGAHAKATSPPATNYHTMSRAIKDWSVNGVSIGEMGLQALIAGHFGVPMTFVSGDWYACQEIEALIPGVVTAPVKRGLSRRSAVSWSPYMACQIIEQAARKSMERIKEVKPLRFDPPLVFRDERYAESWTPSGDDPAVNVIDHNTREITVQDVPELMKKLYGHPRGEYCPDALVVPE